MVDGKWAVGGKSAGVTMAEGGSGAKSHVESSLLSRPPPAHPPTHPQARKTAFRPPAAHNKQVLVTNSPFADDLPQALTCCRYRDRLVCGGVIWWSKFGRVSGLMVGVFIRGCDEFVFCIRFSAVVFRGCCFVFRCFIVGGGEIFMKRRTMVLSGYVC